MTGELYHTFINTASNGDDRRALVYKLKNQWVIEMYINSKKHGEKIIENHSEQYAEDAAENWVMEWGSFA